MSFSRIAPSFVYIDPNSKNSAPAEKPARGATVDKTALAAGLDIAAPPSTRQASSSAEMKFNLPWLVWAAHARAGGERPAPARIIKTLKWSESAILWHPCGGPALKARRQVHLVPLQLQKSSSIQRPAARRFVKSLLNFCASLAF